MQRAGLPGARRPEAGPGRLLRRLLRSLGPVACEWNDWSAGSSLRLCELRDAASSASASFSFAAKDWSVCPVTCDGGTRMKQRSKKCQAWSTGRERQRERERERGGWAGNRRKAPGAERRPPLCWGLRAPLGEPFDLRGSEAGNDTAREFCNSDPCPVDCSFGLSAPKSLRASGLGHPRPRGQEAKRLLLVYAAQSSGSSMLADARRCSQR